MLLSVAARAADALAPTPLVLDPGRTHDVDITRPEPDLIEVRTRGEDPWVATRTFQVSAPTQTVLELDYTTLTAVPGFSVYVGTPWSEDRVHAVAELPPSEGWSTFAVDLAPAWARARTPPRQLRLDFGQGADRTVQIRGVRLREPNARERAISATREARQAAARAEAAGVRAYLEASHLAAITRVRVTATTVEISGRLPAGGGEYALAEAPPWETVPGPARPEPVAALHGDAAGFVLQVPRWVADGAGPRDRLLSRWLVLRRMTAGHERVSAARYADEVEARHAWPETRARSRKGLGGFNVARPELIADLDALGIDSVTVNLFLSRFLRAEASEATLPHAHLGRTYHLHRAEVEKLDRTLRAAAQRGVLVLGILLVPPAKGWDGALGGIFQHPDYDPAGTYSMPNLTTREGVEHYAALLHFLAERYSRPGAPFGRLHHWIVHNEVDAGWVWTNCGEKPPELYLEIYHRSMRLAHLIARAHDPHARAYVSLTHHWKETASHRFTPSRDVLEGLLAYSRTEGDFDWGIAFHPYPQSLRDPRTWRDQKAEFHYDTPMITFRNLEVLDAWVKEPAHRFEGRKVRSVHLSEQGPNSPDYTPRALTEQAAAMAYVWRKLRPLDAIEGFQFHNWADNRREGGLRIGLRRFGDDPEAPLAPKPVWHVYRALDTAEEEAATAFALPVIGIADWSEVPHRGPIGRQPAR
ncbi:MAG: DUF5722 domain-containing protein [Opitutaceae bacterium]